MTRTMNSSYLYLIIAVTLTTMANAQIPKSMQWLNEPNEWQTTVNKISFEVTPQTDYWNKTHYGFTVTDAPFYYSQISGEFEAVVKMSGAYKTRFDQVCMMIRIDENNWIKSGIEYVGDVYNISTVHTVGNSSWSVLPLSDKPGNIWIKAIRKLDAVEIFYSADGVDYTMTNIVYFPEFKSVQVGVMAASPDGEGFLATFEDFHVKHLPDQRRLQWLEKDKD